VAERTRRVRRKTLGGVGEHVDGCGVKRKHAGEPHAPTCMGLKEVLDTEDAISAARMGASSVVIGGPLVPADRGDALRHHLRVVVAGVRG